LTCEFAGVFEGVFAKKIRGSPALTLQGSRFWAGRTVFIPTSQSFQLIAKCSMDRASADFRAMLTLLAVLNAGVVHRQGVT
jgi:hypothetical protein